MVLNILILIGFSWSHADPASDIYDQHLKASAEYTKFVAKNPKASQAELTKKYEELHGESQKAYAKLMAETQGQKLKALFDGAYAPRRLQPEKDLKDKTPLAEKAEKSDSKKAAAAVTENVRAGIKREAASRGKDKSAVGDVKTAGAEQVKFNSVDVSKASPSEKAPVNDSGAVGVSFYDDAH